MKNAIQVIKTDKFSNDKLTKKKDIYFKNEKGNEEFNVINIYDDIEFQEMIGIGGAFTEAAAVTLNKLPEEKRNKLLNAYFNPVEGIGYSLCRTSIHSNDFSTSSYTYIKDKDTTLNTFDISRDKDAVIKMIKDATSVDGANFKLIASPWSPPGFMKTNKIMVFGGKLKEEYKDLWAKYIARYIKEYKKQGVEIFGITVQNEPNATQIWESCTFSPKEESDFIAYNLGPILELEGLSNIKICMWDHNKERIYDRAKEVLKNEAAYKYIWGIAYHWYTGEHFDALNLTHEKFPSKAIIFSEGCGPKEPIDGGYDTAEYYAYEIINNLNNWTNGFMDWNMILDEQGGPNHVKNYCTAPVIIDTKTKEIHYKPAYYYIGHFSKYITPGAKRIGSSKFSGDINVTAFKNIDGSIIAVILNKSDTDHKINLRYNGKVAKFESTKHSIHTLIF